MDLWSVILYIASAVVNLMFGALWYHPKVFGAVWVRNTNISPEMAERGRRHVHLYNGTVFITGFVSAVIFRYLEQAVGMTSALGALLFGVVMSFGCMLPVLLGQLLWDQKPRLFLVNAGFWLCSAMLTALVVSA